MLTEGKCMELSTIRGIVESILFMRRMEGWSSALGMSLRFVRLFIFDFRRGYAFRRTLNEEPRDIPAPDMDVIIRQATFADLAILGEILPPLRLKRIGRKLQGGEKCVIALKDQKPIAYVFAAFADSPSTQESHLNLGAREAYIWAGYVMPQFRRHGIVRAVNLYLCRLLQKEGYESTVLVVDRHNKASLGHVRKTGYRMTDRVMFLRVLGWKRAWTTPVEEPV